MGGAGSGGAAAKDGARGAEYKGECGEGIGSGIIASKAPRRAPSRSEDVSRHGVRDVARGVRSTRCGWYLVTSNIGKEQSRHGHGDPRGHFVLSVTIFH